MTRASQPFSGDEARGSFGGKQILRANCKFGVAMNHFCGAWRPPVPLSDLCWTVNENSLDFADLPASPRGAAILALARISR